ncbi:MAG: D-alanyl-D-alanine carboxypeptidase / D-alanyl-D-alanine-endopeptidase DacB [Bacteroidetes bacterium HLUCCA01]|nr:MAG: D-alanyl-D-alanine carboxypeptidase / D-alanyl-D-alanine-endopeptidase DacB [Bacteroidetes bacterium HLUCCA01]
MAANYLNGSYRMLKTVVLGMTGIFLLLSADPADAQFRSPNDVDTTPGSSEPAATSAEFGFSTAYRSELVRQIIPHLNHPEFENAWWGIHVRDLRSGATVFSRYANKGFMPASNTKLYTTAAGLELLGPEYHYHTRLWKMGSVEDGVFRGSLIVEGSGDPTISGRFNDGDRTEVMRKWAEELKAQGITRIEGNIIGDDSLFDDVRLGRAWSWDYTSYWYAAEMGALSFNDNTIDVVMVGQQPGEPAAITWEPFETNYVQIINETTTVPRNESRRSGYDREWMSNTIRISNEIPAGDTVRYSPSITNPALYFVHVMSEEFERQGISVEADLYDSRGLGLVPDYRSQAEVAAVHVSPSLGEIIYILNQRSQNFYAENLLKTIGAYYKRMLTNNPDLDLMIGSSPRLFAGQEFGPEYYMEPVAASAGDGHDAAWFVYGAAGVDTTKLRLADGSGLSRVNVVTPQMTTALLQFMWNHPDPAIRDAFLASLPRPGEEIGTITNLFRNGAARETVMAKTGTIGMARALSGYVRAADGTPLAFSIMVNHHTESNTIANRIIENVVNTLASFEAGR